MRGCKTNTDTRSEMGTQERQDYNTDSRDT